MKRTAGYRFRSGAGYHCESGDSKPAGSLISLIKRVQFRKMVFKSRLVVD